MRFRFVMGRAISGFFSHFSMTFAVVLVTFVSFLFVGAGLLSQVQIDNMKQHWYAKVEVTVYMCAEADTSPNCHKKAATPEEIEAVRTQLESAEMQSYISSVYFQTKEEAFKDFKEQYSDSAIIEATTPDMLPESFRIKLKDPTQFKVIAAAIEGKPGVESVQDQQKIVKPLFDTLSKLSIVAFSLAGIEIIAAVLLMMTTIRLSAMVRSKETRILRFVGASNLFIQLPFMIETAVSALIGAILAIFTLALGMHYGLESWIEQNFGLLGVVTLADVWRISPILIFGAVIFAALASAIALAKYAKA